jgi:hypothetical protein
MSNGMWGGIMEYFDPKRCRFANDFLARIKRENVVGFMISDLDLSRFCKEGMISSRMQHVAVQSQIFWNQPV